MRICAHAAVTQSGGDGARGGPEAAAAARDHVTRVGEEEMKLESNPGISVSSSSVVPYMDSVAAFCHTDAADVEWYVNALLVTSNDRMTISPDGKMLVIHRVGRDDRVLQCAIKNIFGLLQRSEQISLTVAYGPDSVLLRTDPHHIRGIVSAEIGTRVRLECVSTSLPGPKYRWVHHGSLLSFSEANITLPSLAWEQMGRYRCVVENPVAQLSMYRDVEVQRPRKCSRFPSGAYPLPVSPPPRLGLGGTCHQDCCLQLTLRPHSGWVEPSHPLEV
ncbi:Carcinoembryonic antigen-related cell adhesion molecule 18 [Pteropus alecto]|uniref:Carcinoembryonic antigen-related cell adhesion molecule 18 n=1 Tax=Pteropus alecto TaxID=9402 RepID=L5L4Z3_PTEAL|nr:Carcinoembryonic antigen-related cell adhesion molecule 18 [Pteropus alecto]